MSRLRCLDVCLSFAYCYCDVCSAWVLLPFGRFYCVEVLGCLESECDSWRGVPEEEGLLVWLIG